MAGDLTTQIGVTADSSGVVSGLAPGKKALRELGNEAVAAGKQASDGVEKFGKGGKRAAKDIDAATKNMISSIQRQIAATEAGSKSGSDYFRMLASQRGINGDALKPYLEQLDAVTAKQKSAQKIITATAPALDRVGISAKQTAAALRGVPAQFTDILVSLQGGQNPLTVFLQQGGQLKDMFGGAGAAAKALGGYVVGLINPFTIAAGAAGALAFAYNKGSQEADAYAKALIMTGNAAGMTVDQLQMMAERIGYVSATQSEAAAALAAFAGSTNISGESLEKFAAVAVNMEKTVGQAVGDTVKQFSELGKDPVAASLKLNETTRFLTAEVYNQIKALQEQGRASEAAAIAQNAYADTMNSRMDQLAGRLGTIEKLWKDIKFGASLAWDAMLGIGRPDTLSQQIDKQLEAREGLERQLQSTERYGDSQRATYLKNQLDANKALINGLRDRRDAEKTSANQSKSEAGRTSGAIALDRYLNDPKNADNKTRLSIDLKGENAAFAEATKGLDANSKEYAAALTRHKQNIAKINEQYADKGASKAAARSAKSLLGFDVDQIRIASESLLNTLANSEKIMEARRSAGLLSDREYYGAKRKFIEDNTKAQIDALTAENARIAQEKGNADEQINNQKRMAENLAKIAILRANSAAGLEVLSINEAAAAKRLEVSFLTARQAAQDYFDTIAKQQERELSSFGLGNRQRNFNAGINQIEDRYAGQRRDLENQRAQLEMEGKFTDESRKQYENRLAIINEFQQRAISSYTDYYDQLIEKQRDWSLGATEALTNYFEDSQNVMSQSSKLFTDVFSSMEDAITKFVTTGKLSFKDLADSIVADITRMIVKQKITGPLANMISGGMSSGSGFGGMLGNFFGSLFGRAIGGPVSAGGMYEVNEKGRPELLSVAGKQYLMMGSQGGKVNANPQGGGNPTNLYVTVAPPANTSRATAKQWGADAGRSMQLAMGSNN